MRWICPYIAAGGYSGDIGHPPSFKAENASPTYLHQLCGSNPNAVGFMRWTEQENWDDKLRDPEGYAEGWMNLHRASIREVSGLNIVHTMDNEVSKELGEAHARALLRFVRLMHEENAHAGVGEWSVGNPPEENMHLYDKVFQEMRPGDVVTAHHYWDSFETLRQNIEAIRTGKGLPWHFRLFWPGWLDGMVKAITETGFDWLSDLNRGGAWKRIGVNDEEYLYALRYLDDFLDERDDVIGAHVFILGHVWDSKWRDYRVDDLWPFLVATQEQWAPKWKENQMPTIRVGFPNGRIEVMDIEEYVRHVVPYEMPTYARLEALKAQAVCARSYALANKGKHGSFDVCTTQHCQVYGEGTYPTTDRAIEETKGFVGIFEGKIVPTFFSAYCGGHTTDLNFAETAKVRYLRSAVCSCPLTTAQQLRAYYAKNGGGHQRGLCQRGAMGMTERFLDTLNHYFNCEWRKDYGAGAILGEKTDKEKLDILWDWYMQS